MNIYELTLDGEEMDGIDAISIVESPAIEEDFIALKSQDFKLAEVSKEKRILLGALLIPNKPIYRRNEKEEYYVYFSKETVREASQLYLTKGNQNNTTLEHEHTLSGLTLVESWIVEDTEKDKSKLYNMSYPVGTWVGSVKVKDEDVWNNYVKTGKVKGFSIEGQFSNKKQEKEASEMSKEDLDFWQYVLNIIEYAEEK